jgi:phosphatidylinositol 4-kinase
LILSPLVSLTEDISTSNNTYIPIDKIKEDIKNKYKTFNNFFRNYFLNNFEEAQRNFTESLASYSLFSYLINNNINIFNKSLLNNSGSIALKINGYSLSSNNNNCKNIFKLPINFLEILDGKNSSMFNYYKSIISKGIIEIKKFYENFEILINIIIKSCQIENWSNRDKFYIIESLKERFHVVNNEIDIINDVNLLIEKAYEKKGFFSMFNK